MVFVSSSNGCILTVIHPRSRIVSMDIDPCILVSVGNNSVTVYNWVKKRYLMISGPGAVRDVTDAFDAYPDASSARSGTRYCDMYGETYIVDGVLYGVDKAPGDTYYYYDTWGRVIGVSTRDCIRLVGAQLARYNHAMQWNVASVAPLVMINGDMRRRFGPGGSVNRTPGLQKGDCLGVVTGRLAVIRSSTLVGIWDGHGRVLVNRSTSGGSFVFRGSYVCHFMENMVPSESPTRIRVYDARMHCLADALMPHHDGAMPYSCLIWPLSRSSESAIRQVKRLR